MSEYDRVLKSELENILDLISGTQPARIDVSEFIDILNRKLSPEARQLIKKFLH